MPGKVAGKVNPFQVLCLSLSPHLSQKQNTTLEKAQACGC